ncbi:MAG: hypothetical protein AAGE86_13325 [Pseudomonadota bacterium]
MVALVTHAVHARELAGETTTLRQLHQVTNISQATALRVVYDLEDAGAFEIEPDEWDRFASRIALTKTMRDEMERASRAILKQQSA